MFLHIVQVIRVLKMLGRIFWIHDLITIDTAVNYGLVNSTGCVPMLPGLRPVQLAWSCCWGDGVLIRILVTRMISWGPKNNFVVHVQESWGKALWKVGYWSWSLKYTSYASEISLSTQLIRMVVTGSWIPNASAVLRYLIFVKSNNYIFMC